MFTHRRELQGIAGANGLVISELARVFVSRSISLSGDPPYRPPVQKHFSCSGRARRSLSWVLFAFARDSTKEDVSTGKHEKPLGTAYLLYRSIAYAMQLLVKHIYRSGVCVRDQRTSEREADSETDLSDRQISRTCPHNRPLFCFLRGVRCKTGLLAGVLGRETGSSVTKIDALLDH
jgi:hypothetical protein